MFFLTLCPVSEYDYFFDPAYGASDFLGFVSVTAFLAIPIGIFVFLWRNFATDAADPTPEEIVFSFEHPPVYFAEAGLSTWMVALYLLAGLATFSLGVLVSEIVHSFT
jgi:hypothetical protein